MSTTVHEPAEFPEHPGDDGAALVEAAGRRRVRRPARERRERAQPAAPASGRQASSLALPAVQPPTAARPRRPRKPPADPASVVLAPLSGAQEPLPSQRAASGRWPQRMRPWSWVAMATGLGIAVLALVAAARRPEPAPVLGIAVRWLDGPQVAEREWRSWLAAFPQRDQLGAANDWLLAKLRAYLAGLPAVAEAQRVALVPRAGGGREIEIVLRLNQPVLPIRLADGRGGWVDEAGRILPAALPGPVGRAPLLTGIEAGGTAGLRGAIDLWLAIRDRIEPGLLAGIECDGSLDDGTGQRGLVLTTRGGGRIVWGRPADAQFGVDEAGKRDRLLAALRQSGDLAQYHALNLRYGPPFLTLKP